MAFDDFFADSQTDAVAGIFSAGVQPVENYEDAFGVLGGNADTVVGDREDRFASFLSL